MLAGKAELDIFIPEYQIAIEYDGSGFHDSATGLKRAQRKYAYLRDRGMCF